MKICPAIAAFLLLSFAAHAQQKQQALHKAQSPSATADRLGMTCAQILAMTSTGWIAKSVQAHAATGDGEVRGILVYGQCYDARTDQLAAALLRKGTGPKKTALANLKNFQQELQDFTAKTLADTTPPADPTKIAYANLYEKQFRHEFYEAFEQKTLKPATPSKTPRVSAAKSPETSSTATTSTPAGSPDNGSANSSPLPSAPKTPLIGVPDKSTVIPSSPPPPRTTAVGTGSTTPLVVSAPSPVPSGAESTSTPTKEVDPFTKAKNHFGELLGLLPEDQMHEVHSAFGKLFSGNPVSEDLKIEVYTYAIFLLERPSDQKFAPPPF
jgi:hypothetical protein